MNEIKTGDAELDSKLIEWFSWDKVCKTNKSTQTGILALDMKINTDYNVSVGWACHHYTLTAASCS